MQQEQIRVRLSQAARQLVDADGARVSATAVATAAALPQQSIAQNFGDFDTLLCELLGQLYGEARHEIVRATANMVSSRSRLKLIIDVYLQALLQRPGLQALGLRLRFHPRGSAVVRQNLHGLTLLLQIELKSLGWAQPAATARLAAAAIVGISLAEAAAGRALPDLRDTLLGYYDCRSA